jgi:hypothetical protein
MSELRPGYELLDLLRVSSPNGYKNFALLKRIVAISRLTVLPWNAIGKKGRASLAFQGDIRRDPFAAVNMKVGNGILICFDPK